MTIQVQGLFQGILMFVIECMVQQIKKVAMTFLLSMHLVQQINKVAMTFLLSMYLVQQINKVAMTFLLSMYVCYAVSDKIRCILLKQETTKLIFFWGGGISRAAQHRSWVSYGRRSALSSAETLNL